MLDVTGAPSTVPTTPTMSRADEAAHRAASHVRPTPKSIVAKAEARTGLTARGLAALQRLEADTAWGER